MNEIDGNHKSNLKMGKKYANWISPNLLKRLLNEKDTNLIDEYLNSPEGYTVSKKLKKLLELDSDSQVTLRNIWAKVKKINESLKQSGSDSENNFELAQELVKWVTLVTKSLSETCNEKIYSIDWSSAHNMSLMLTVLWTLYNTTCTLDTWIRSNLPRVAWLSKAIVIKDFSALQLNISMDFRFDKLIYDKTMESSEKKEKSHRRTSVFFNEHKMVQDMINKQSDASKVIYLRSTHPTEKYADEWGYMNNTLEIALMFLKNADDNIQCEQSIYINTGESINKVVNDFNKIFKYAFFFL